jgi:kanamycin kinase
VLGTPRKSIEIPESVRAVAGGGSVRAVWENELGGLTFEVGAGPERRFIKWAPAGNGLSRYSEVLSITQLGRAADTGPDTK